MGAMPALPPAATANILRPPIGVTAIPTIPRDNAAAGLAYALAAYGMWGLLPLYWKALGAVPATEILAHRVVWSLAFCLLLLALARRWRPLAEALRPGRRLLALCATAGLISVNWLIYIWAVNAGFVLETSLGYFINPLVNVLLGRLVLGERLRRRQKVAVGLAATGVGVLTVGLGVPPWIALSLAITFSLYGLLRKMTPVEPLAGMAVETALIAPAALAWLLWLGGDGAFGEGAGDVLLVLTGVVTATPLIFFAAAARRLRYATLGFLQYLAPTMHFTLAVAVFGEPLLPVHLVTFACIWAAIAIYLFDSVAVARAAGAAVSGRGSSVPGR